MPDAALLDEHRFHIRLPPDLRAELAAVAAAQYCSKSAVVRLAIREYIDRHGSPQ